MKLYDKPYLPSIIHIGRCGWIMQLLFLCSLMGAGRAAAQKVQVDEQLDSLEMVMGQQCHLFLTITTSPKADVIIPSFEPNHLMTRAIEVLDIAKVDSVVLDDGALRQTVAYTLTCFEPKLQYLPPLEIIVDGKKYSGKKLALKVLDVPVDTTKLDQFFPAKDIQTNPFSWDEWMPLIVLYAIASLLMVIGMMCYLMRLGNKPIRISFRIIKRVPAHVKAMTSIDKIKEDRVVLTGNQKEYYTRLTDTLRNYMQERFGFSAMEMTTREIIDRLQTEDPAKVAELRELFETADLVKFAKYSAMANESDRNLVSAIDFINSTKTEEVVEEKREETKLTVEEQQKNTSLKLLRVLIYIAVTAAAAIVAFILWQVVQLIE